MKAALFVLGNGGALGHFNAAYIIAQEIIANNRKNKVTIVSDDDFSKLVTIERVKFIKISSRKNSGGEGFRLQDDYGDELMPIVSKLKPDLMIFETFFPEDFLKQIRRKKSKKILLVKGYTKEGLKIFLRSSYEKYFDSIMLLGDLGSSSSNVVKEINKRLRKKTFYSFAPLIKSFSQNYTNKLVKKYAINKDAFVVVAALGGGGHIIEGKKKEAALYLACLIGAFNSFKKSCKKLKFIVITGPFFGVRDVYAKNLIIKKYEKNLMELMNLSDLVISQGGYNTLNEILSVGTPAIVIPAERSGSDDQRGRAQKLEKLGGAKIIKSLDKKVLTEELNKLNKNRELLDQMRNKLKKGKLKDGNKEIIKFLVNI